MANVKISDLTDETAVQSADRMLLYDASGSGTQWKSVSCQKVVERAHLDLGITPQNRISTTTDPGANDDGAGTNGINHLVNDLWTNTTDDTSWICVDTTTNAAVWKPIALTKTGTAAPAVAPDFVGQLFLDTTNENIYIGIDTVNAADFLQVNGAGGIADLVDDTTPQLGGPLDVNGQEITGAIDLHSTGDIVAELGDAVGTNKLSIRDSAGTEQAAIDSDGNITTNGTVDGRDVAADGALAASAMQDLVDDTTPQLGGDLDTNGNKIQGAQQTLTFVASSINLSTPAPASTGVAELINSHGAPMRVDLTGFTETRVTVMRGSTTRTNLTLAIKYKTGAPTATYGDYSALGASGTEVEILCPTQNTFYQSAWISLDSGAIADDISLAMCWTDGTSGSNVALIRVMLELR